MSESKWTPGPWEFVPVEQWPFGVKVVAGDKVILRQDAVAHSTRQKTRADCEMAVGFDAKDASAMRAAVRKQDANARLIAAAPELLEALEDALRWIGRLTDWEGAGDPDVDTWRAALNKAKGEQS